MLKLRPRHDITFWNGASTVGRCCTLVEEQLFLYLLKRHGCGVTVVNGGLELVILGTVLLDTMNIDPTAGVGQGGTRGLRRSSWSRWLEFVRGEEGGMLVLLTLYHVGTGRTHGYDIKNAMGVLGGHFDKKLFDDQL